MLFLQGSQKRLINSLNPVFHLGIVALLIVVRTTLDPLLPNFVLYWDILLPVAIYIGQKRNLAEAFIITFLSAHFYSLCSMAPMGQFVIYYLLIMLTSRAVSTFFNASHWYSIFTLLLTISVISRFYLYFMAQIFDHPWPFWGWGLVLPFTFILNTLLGLPVYLILLWLDRLTDKAPRTQIQIEGGEL